MTRPIQIQDKHEMKEQEFKSEYAKRLYMQAQDQGTPENQKPIMVVNGVD